MNTHAHAVLGDVRVLLGGGAGTYRMHSRKPTSFKGGMNADAYKRCW